MTACSASSAASAFLLADDLAYLNTWGWLAIAFGAIELLAAMSIWMGARLGAGSESSLRASPSWRLMLIPAAPYWALTLVALDVLVTFGLAVYGGHPQVTE